MHIKTGDTVVVLPARQRAAKARSLPFLRRRKKSSLRALTRLRSMLNPENRAKLAASLKPTERFTRAKFSLFARSAAKPYVPLISLTATRKSDIAENAMRNFN